MDDFDLPPGFGGPSSVRSHPAPVAPALLQTRTKRPRPRKVTWAKDEKLFEVRLFAAEDAPYLAGVGYQDRLKAKMSKFMHAADPVARGDLPPGFAYGREKQAPKRMVDAAAIAAVVPKVAWRRPPFVRMNESWGMMAGEASEEVKTQQDRQVRLLEAVYPRSSAIPHSPAEPQELPQDIQDEYIPQIPLVPVEEDAAEQDEAARFPTPRIVNNDVGRLGVTQAPVPVNGTTSYAVSNGMFGQQPPGAWLPRPVMPQDTSRGIGFRGTPPNAGSMVFPPVSGSISSSPLSSSQQSTAQGVPNAASVVAEAVEKSREAGSQIDSELLLNILTNPSLIQALLGKNGGAEGLNLSQTVGAGAPPLPHCVGGTKPQDNRADFQHSAPAPAFVQHPSLPPLAYPTSTQMQGGHVSTSWR